MLIQGQVSNAAPNSRASGQPNALLGQLGEVWVTELLPRYGAMAWSNLVFFGANNGAQAMSANSSTFTGLAIANPTGSGKNLMILDVTVAVAAAAAALATPRLGYAAYTSGLFTGATTGPTGLPTLVGSGVGSIAKVAATCTLSAAPTTLRPIMGLHWITAGTTTCNLYTKDEVAGAIVIPPGQILTFDALVAAATTVCAATWAEIPL